MLKKLHAIPLLLLVSIVYSQENNPSIGINTSLSGNLSSGDAIAIGDSDTGIKQQGDGELGFYTNNIERIRVDKSGNIGIGASEPKSKLHINGDLYMNAGEGFRVFGTSDYFGGNIYDDAIIFEMQDTNSNNGNTDGGFVFRGLTTGDSVSKDWMTIKNGGFVGIGTKNPKTRFHLQVSDQGVKSQYGIAIIEHTDSQLDLISSSDGTWGSAINFIESAGTTNRDIWSIVRETTNGNGNSSLKFNFGTVNNHINDSKVIFEKTGRVIASEFKTSTNGTLSSTLRNNDLSFTRDNLSYINCTNPNGGLAIRTGGTDNNDLVVNNQGNVSIGTGLSDAKLHVNGDMFMNIGEGFKVFGDGNYFGQFNDGIIFQMQDTNAANGTTDGGFVFRGYTTTDNVASNDWMVIKNGGKVGIGTSDPKNKLSVEGTIWAKEVKVSLTDAADWVFEEDYTLRPLTEVESYIKENKHLPEMPSAEEFRKNDLKVSEMTNKLLQKIEELTLYTIEQEKKLENMEALQQKNTELELRLEKIESLLTK